MITIALKDLRILARNPVGLFWVLGFPLVFACLFGSVNLVDLGSATLTVALVDDAGTPASRQVAGSIAGTGQLEVRRLPTRDAARDAVLDGRAEAYVHLPPNFPATPIELGLDPARPAAAAIVEGRLLLAALGSVVPGVRDRVRREPVHRIRPATGYEIAFPAAMLWAILGCSASFAISIATEREAGTLVRLRMAPIGRARILAGKALACLITSHLAVLLLLTLALLAFDVRLADPLAFALSASASAVAFAGLMMAIATFGRDAQATAGAGWAALLLMAMLGGGMVPLVAMPEWMRDLSVVSPVRWAIVALEGAIWRDTGIQWDALGLLAGCGVAGFATGALRLRG